MSSHQLDEERIFHLGRQLPTAEGQAEYLDQICAGDQALRERVEELLRVHQEEQTFLKSSGDPAPIEPITELSVAPGQQIGRYKLLQKIGEGGFGVVFMAEQSRPVRRKVALKVIKPGMDTGAVVARFEAERQALAMMDHPNIARVFDGGATDGGRPYFVMELVKGVPITEYCDQNQLPAVERLELFAIVCQAVQHAHQKGVIHRDLKPSNILVTLHDGKPVVKVIDFGIAKAINQQLTEKTLFTAYGQMLGTPQYMSPEQAEMSGLDVDTRSDIYSLGVILYELLTGTTPLETGKLREAGYAEIQRLIREQEPAKPSIRLSSTGEKLTAIAKQRSVSPERLTALIRGDLDWVVMKALEKDRQRRYSSPNELAQDIRYFLESKPVTARRPTVSYRLQKFLKRNTASVAITLLTSLIAVGLGVGLWQRLQTNQIESKLATSLRSDIQNLILAGRTRDALERLFSGRSRDIIDEPSGKLLEAQIRLFEGDYEECIRVLQGLDIPANSENQVAINSMLAIAQQRAGREVLKFPSFGGRALRVIQDRKYISCRKSLGGVAFVGAGRWSLTIPRLTDGDREGNSGLAFVGEVREHQAAS